MGVAASKGSTKVAAMARALLQTEGLIRRFGGVVPANAITLDIASDEVHAVIGPNGAGKSTLVGLLSGEVTPQEGSIHFDGADITRLPVYRRSRLGLARSFQITSLFHDFSALDNVALAVQAHRGHSFRFWRDARREEVLRKPALAALVRVGLGERAAARVDKLSHGEHRQLEIAMALATQPPPVARRANGRHGAGRICTNGSNTAPAQGQYGDPFDRARHGGGIRAGGSPECTGRRMHHC